MANAGASAGTRATGRRSNAAAVAVLVLVCAGAASTARGELEPATLLTRLGALLHGRPVAPADIEDAMQPPAEHGRSFSRFLAWAREHSRTYRSMQELHQRFKNWIENEARALEMTADVRDGATYGIESPFADMKPEEFRATRLIPMDAQDVPKGRQAPPLSTDNLPPHFDWRDKGAVTAIRNQENCGSCWAHAAVENIESQWYLHGAGNDLVPLSVQQIVDCDASNCGCYGGWPQTAYEYAMRDGLMPESEYRYCVPPVGNCFVCLANKSCNTSIHQTNFCNHRCEYSASRAVARAVDWMEVAQDEEQIAAWLVKQGPLAVVFNANHLMLYMRGVSAPWWCAKEELNHAVLLVGYGEDVSPILRRPRKFWILKNSWGPKWGEGGYFRMLRGAGKCGLNSHVSTALVG
eukprot:tig00000754_g3902.t1